MAALHAVSRWFESDISHECFKDMTEIPVYDDKGNQINSIFISESIDYIDGRVSKGEKYYYKGVGVPYKSHYSHVEKTDTDYKFIEKSNVFYLGNLVEKLSYKHKTGIFQERYQPHFTDWIGACGIKELNILENLYDEDKFEMNGIEVFGYEVIDESENQYYLKVDYPERRVSYLNNPNPKELRNLLDYMIQNDWNFPWDKDSISDISSKSKVTDVADVFKSNDIIHKIGTVYSVLYSLYNSSQLDYMNFCSENNMNHGNRMSFVFNSLYILHSNGVDISSLSKETPVETYKHIVLNYLVVGKNCGFCGVGSCKGRKDSNQYLGDEIRDEYVKRTSSDLRI